MDTIPASDLNTTVVDLDAYEHLFVAVFRLAIRDAQDGDSKAAEWLDEMVPNWQQRVMPGARHTLVQRGIVKEVAQNGLGNAGRPTLLLPQSAKR